MRDVVYINVDKADLQRGISLMRKALPKRWMYVL